MGSAWVHCADISALVSYGHHVQHIVLRTLLADTRNCAPNLITAGQHAIGETESFGETLRNEEEMMNQGKYAPSAPVVENYQQPIQYHGTTAPPLAVPAPLPPSVSSKGIGSWFWLTIKLIPYHLLNFALGMAAFCVVVTGLSLSIGLLPLCGLGIIFYLILLQAVRVLVIVDVALANAITRSQTGVHLLVPKEIDENSTMAYQLHVAPKLAKCSLRSTVAILYFGTVKFVLALISLLVVCLPMLPIVAEFLRGYATDTANNWVAGFPIDKINLRTNPFMYVLTCILYFIVGIVLMHVFGRISRETTRRMCCKEIMPTISSGDAV